MAKLTNLSKVQVEEKGGASVTEEQWNFCSLQVGQHSTTKSGSPIYLGSFQVGSHLAYQEPLHLGEWIRVDNFCSPDGDGEIALIVDLETDSGYSFEIALMGDSLHNYGNVLELPTDENTPILVQEAFEGGKVRHSEFVSWWLPLETNMESDDLVMEELVTSEERNTLTGSKEGLVWESVVPVFHPSSAKELTVTWTYRARRVF